MSCLICGTIERLKTAKTEAGNPVDPDDLLGEVFACGFVLGGVSANSETVHEIVRDKSCPRHREMIARHFEVAAQTFMERFPEENPS